MLGKRIKAYLKETYRTQEILCVALGLSQSVVSAMLSGERKISAEEYFVICRTLGVSLDTFQANSTDTVGQHSCSMETNPLEVKKLIDPFDTSQIIDTKNNAAPGDRDTAQGEVNQYESE